MSVFHVLYPIKNNPNQQRQMQPTPNMQSSDHLMGKKSAELGSRTSILLVSGLDFTQHQPPEFKWTLKLVHLFHLFQARKT